MKNISKRKGVVVFDRELLLNSEEIVLKTIFSEFFPIDIDNNHEFGFYKKLNYFGFSSQFREIEDEIQVPIYEVVLKEENINGEGQFLIEFKEIKK